MGTPVLNAGTMLACTPFGTAPSTLGVLPTPCVMAAKTPAAVMTDTVPFVNIMPFGMCSSPSNPLVIAALGVPQPCVPVPVGTWTTASATCMAGKKSLITTSACLMCQWGGMIKATAPGQVQTLAAAP